MKQEMSSLDIMAEIAELQFLQEARINKVFQTTPSELKFQLNVRGRGRIDLIIEPGRRIHTTGYPRPSPETPSNYIMTLRKYIGNGIFKKIRQLAFDRIVELKIRGKEGQEFFFIAELFGKGNAVLTDENYKIRAIMKPQRFAMRELVGSATYKFPPVKRNPFELEAEEIKEEVKKSRSDLVRTLATTLGLGGLYAEEVCKRAGLEKNKNKINQRESEKIARAIMSLMESEALSPAIVFEKGKPKDLIPVKLEIYKDMEKKEFKSFNEAVDEYFSKYEMERIDVIKDEKFRKELDSLRRRLKKQTHTLKKFLHEETLYKQIGDKIYLYFQDLEEIITSLKTARNDYTWKEIKEKIQDAKDRVPQAKLIKQILPGEGSVLVNLDGNDVILDIRKSVAQNADYYYEKSKKVKEKQQGALKAIKNTVIKIKQVKKRGKESYKVEEKKPLKKEIRKREWYEKFRWFFSSDGFLVIGGKDATSNEVIVKKHLEPGDIFVHADIHGAPAVAIKAGNKEVPENTIQEAFDFSAAYSRAWKHGIFALDVYWVNPEQVSKTPKSGEFVPKGAFIIRGKRNEGKGKVEAAIGVIFNEETSIVGGPTSAIEKTAKYYVRVIPGRDKSKELAKKIKNSLMVKADEKEKETIEGFNLEDIQEFLPPGTGELREE